MCERCFAVKDLPTEIPPDGCSTCGSTAAWVGPYVPEARITRRGVPESTPESPFYMGASFTPAELLPADR
jgi:hypothetical protein